MRVRYSFSSRHTGRARDSAKNDKQRAKYPEVLQKVIRQSHIVLEVLDSRFIEDTRNKELEAEILEKGKKIIYVINKADLNPALENLPQPSAIVSCSDRRGIKNLRNMIKIFASRVSKETGFERIYVGVVGYPNTGKSSLINILIGRNSAKTGSEAGFTKGVQKLRLAKGITLLDSAGVIPSKEYSSSDSRLASKNTKVSARSYSQVKNPEQVVSDLMIEYPGVFEKYYKIDANGDSDVLIETLGKKKSFMIRGGEIDFDRTAKIILKDWQEGRIRVKQKQVLD